MDDTAPFSTIVEDQREQPVVIEAMLRWLRDDDEGPHPIEVVTHDGVTIEGSVYVWNEPVATWPLLVIEPYDPVEEPDPDCLVQLDVRDIRKLVIL